MEGKFRILQTYCNEFRIQKEIECFTTVPGSILGIPIGCKRIKKNIWVDVDRKGNRISWITAPVFYSNLDSAIRGLNKIKEFPKVVYEGKLEDEKSNIPYHGNVPPPPPKPQQPKKVKQGRVIPKTTPEQRHKRLM